MSETLITQKIHITGIVQGVGFRPYVFNLASKLSINGWVRNTSSGLEIVASGEPSDLDSFIQALRNHPPTLAHVDSFEAYLSEYEQYNHFEIRESNSVSSEFVPISPDISICDDCRRELFDPADRRYRYPFINCTNCGPRFSIIQDIPYDRPLTTMSDFAMCVDCLHEYTAPSDRRYHAQPIACAKCGPEVSLKMPGKTELFAEEAISAARALLREGKILALKGLGGYHLACDALNRDAVEMLRQRKQRSEKPFALMCFDLETMKRFVQISEPEAALLESPPHPIVLLEKNDGVSALDHTAPRQNQLGMMLPYTPLHLLLLEPEPGFPEVLVMTSGNFSEEPIAYQDDEALTRLQPLADAFLLHNRPIHMRVDDSVVRVFDGQSYPIRRARGYAPEPLKVPYLLPQILSCGAELKNTFALSRQGYIFLSHHIGDLENLETFSSFTQGIEHFKRLFHLEPTAIAVDLHPDFLSTLYGQSLSREQNIPLFKVQHHHAHLASCLVDNDYREAAPVIGLIFDGTGYGTDGVIWGGEVLLGGYNAVERVYHLSEIALPGGDSAIRNPAKIALSYLQAAGIDWTPDLSPVKTFQEEQRVILAQQLAHKVNCPLTTSMGRLFDAFSSLLGIRHHISYEGQAAIELENICDCSEDQPYDLPINGPRIDALALFPQILKDMHNGVSHAVIAARFHNAIANCCLVICRKLRISTGVNKVALSGGVWQNMTLLRKTTQLLYSDGFEPLIHHRVPTNDGGISLGQTLIAASMLHAL
jgi:hydrogenase maturation protein HypF